MVKRGEVWLVALDPIVGSEIQKTRPCLVVSPAEMHDHLRTVMVAPMTTGSRPAKFRVPVKFAGKAGLVLVDQIRTVDKVRLIQRKGEVTTVTLAQTLETLRKTFED
jgi:mRNA interferase MazF